MPSDEALDPVRGRRLHPVSLLFSVGSLLKQLFWPALIFLLYRRGDGYELFFLVLLLPSLVIALIRYFSFRYRFAENELVVNEGVFIRKQRHIPYARIQNIDVVQNVAHRLFGVAQVMIETAGGAEPEAKMRVLSLQAVDEMRHHVFAGRTAAAGVTAVALTGAQVAAEGASPVEPGLTMARAAAPPREERVLMRMPLSELVRMGVISNRGMIVVGAAAALIWQSVPDETMKRMIVRFEDRFESWLPDVFQFSWTGTLLMVTGGILLLLLLMRLLSIIWAIVTLYDFTLTASGEELRTRFGLFTRRTSAIPRHRIQVLHVLASPLHRFFRRVCVKIATAGSQAQKDASAGREWLLPLVPVEQLGAHLAVVQPELQLDDCEWRPIDMRIRRRLGRLFMILSLLLVAALVPVAGFWVLAAWPILAGFSAFCIAVYALNVAYALTPQAVLFRVGWWERRISAVRYAKIQTVWLVQSPFDRRWRMATLIIDTAGVGLVGQRVAIPYLAEEEARELYVALSEAAAGTQFRW
ncbi:MAG: PH domain-containing protein [Phycisphaerae bacterium]|nr:PH domain-containing protein [Phycisphaerae bacterium]NUQ46520.1 PH domain-containing protein [Phycisphaerae bacterium]